MRAQNNFGRIPRASRPSTRNSPESQSLVAFLAELIRSFPLPAFALAHEHDRSIANDAFRDLANRCAGICCFSCLERSMPLHDCDPSECLLEQARRAGWSIRITREIMLTDGSARTLDFLLFTNWSLPRLGFHTLMTIREGSARRFDRAAACPSESASALILEKCPHGVIWADAHGFLIRGNEAASALLGLERDGAPVDLFRLLSFESHRHPLFSPDPSHPFEALIDFDRVRRDGILVSAHNGVRAFRGTIVRLASEPPHLPPGFVIHLTDVTVEQRRESKIRDMAKALAAKETALREMMNLSERERKTLTERTQANIADRIMPLLAEMRASTRDEVMRRLVDSVKRMLRDLASDEGILIETASKSLTRREQRIHLLTAQGLTSKEIAEALHLSVRTVEGHRYSIRRKLRAKFDDQSADR